MPVEAGLADAPGCYLGVADTHVDAGERPVTELAADFQRRLMGDVMRQCMRKASFDTEALRSGLAASLESGVFSGFGITNLGQVPLRCAWREFEVVDYLPLAKRVAGNHAFALHVAEFRCETSFHFVYTEPLMDARVMAAVADRFVSLLERCIAERAREIQPADSLTS